MNRELIIICICILFVGLFYIVSAKNTTTQPAEEIIKPATIENNVDDQTKTSIPDSLGN